jgi:hypothetical protein
MLNGRISKRLAIAPESSANAGMLLAASVTLEGLASDAVLETVLDKSVLYLRRTMSHLEKLRSLMGYWQCGSDQIISIAQDGNTGLYWVVCKHKWYECGITLEAAIDTAYEKHGDKFNV